MSENKSDELKKFNEHIFNVRAKREQILESIRSNKNCFDDDVVLCRVVAELSDQISQLEFAYDRRAVLSELGLLDSPKTDD